MGEPYSKKSAGEDEMTIIISEEIGDFENKVRKWNDYMLVQNDNVGAKFIKGYIERFNTVSYFNEFAGLLSFFFSMGQLCAPYMRIPIRGTFIDCRVHTFWIQQSRTGKSIAWEFTDRLLSALGIESESFTAGSDAKLIGTVKEERMYDDNGRPTGETQIITVEGLLNGYKTLVFDEGSVLLNDSKAHFSEKILYLQQAMAPLGSRTNVLVKHLVGGSVRTPSGVSLWMTTFPPKDIMAHVLDKGFFQRVFLFQNDITAEQRHTTSEHRMGGAYRKVKEEIMDYEVLAEYMQGCCDLVRERLWDAMGLESRYVDVPDPSNPREQTMKQELTRATQWASLTDGEREDAAMAHAHDIFEVSAGYHPALFNALDDYYSLVNGIANEHVKETALSFLPNIENYTLIFSNLIATIRRESIITEEHIMMANEIIFDNFHNLIIWLEQKQSVVNKKRTNAEKESWHKAFNQCKEYTDDKDGIKKVLQSDLLKVYSEQQSIAVITTRRRFKTLKDNGLVLITRSGKGNRNFIHFLWGDKK